MQGKRIADGEFPTEKGQYAKHIVKTYKGTKHPGVIVWFLKSPIGGPTFFIGPKPVGGGHEIEENSDGTITVQPKPGNSNSILITWGKGSWHGYIYNGVWKES